MKTKAMAALILTIGCNKIVNLEHKHKNQEFIKKVIDAIISKNLAALSLLLEQMGEKDNLNTLYLESGMAPLHYLVLGNFTEGLSLLLNKNIDINLMNREGKTALDIAEEKRNVAMKSLLLEKGAANTVFLRRVRDAIISRNLVALSKILDQMGENESLNVLDIEKGQAPIHYIASYHIISEGLGEVLELLMRKNIDIDLRNIAGQSALHIAAEHQNIAMIKLLLEKGASPLNLDKYGTTPLIANIVDGGCSLEVFNIFQPHLTNINVKIGPQGKTLLHLVCEKGNVEYVKTLLSLNASVNERDNSGKTALHYAAISFLIAPKIELIETLIQAGADINIVDNCFENVQHLCINYGIDDLIDYFDKKGLKRDIIEKSNVEKLILIMNLQGNVFIDSGRKQMIKEALEVANIKTLEDFNRNRKFVLFLALTFYMRWTKDKFCTSLPDSIIFRNENLDNEEIDLTMLIDIIGALNADDLDDDLKNNSKSLIRNFIGKLNSIKNNTYNDGQGGLVTKRKLKTLVTMLSNDLQDRARVLFVINTLLRQFTTCATGLNAGLDQALEFLGLNNQSNEQLEQVIAKKLHDMRKAILLEALTSTYPSNGQQVHFDLQVLKYFSNELKLEEPYSDIYNIRYEFDADVLRARFWENYTIEAVLTVVKEILVNRIPKVFDYINSLADQNANLHLMECNVFFDEDGMLDEATIKALLIHLGYIKGANAN